MVSIGAAKVRRGRPLEGDGKKRAVRKYGADLARESMRISTSANKIRWRRRPRATTFDEVVRIRVSRDPNHVSRRSRLTRRTTVSRLTRAVPFLVPL